MKINFITIFPNYYKPFTTESITKRAIEKKIIEVNVIDFRNYSINKHNKVDDVVYGGGQGMLLKVQPIHEAIKKTKGIRILLSPQGKTFTQNIARKLALENEISFIAGHYEGFDERIRDYVDLELSIGDFVLTGGELPSMVIADSIVRLIPGVINHESHAKDSFEDGLLDYAQYTNPRSYDGKGVPEVLLNGNHKLIAEWRKNSQLEKTKKSRPDLYKKYLERINHEK